MSEEMHEELGTIAVVGMACRYPGAPDLRTFWENLRNGVESISFFSDHELEEVSPDLASLPNYVKAQGVVADIDLFDAAFFGLTHKEAGIMDPQQRFILECGWQALEHAGYDPDAFDGALGVFAGADLSGYLFGLREDPDLAREMGDLQILIGNAADHLATRLSYLLNLRGPSVTVQTACSTSLVAIHMACQNLLSMESDMAIAGGCSIPVPAKTGYLYEEGGTLSPDGRCRAFDAQAKGTTVGSGVGLVVLKRIEDALDAGDTIHAVIRGSAINNDGSGKIGYTAPSVEGQRRVIRETLEIAELEPADITYVEAHGTGTTLGDPIEFEALRQAYGNPPELRGKIAIGSVKTNIGHCNAAAGVAGLIKTVLCLRHATLVPSLHFENPNPRLDMENSPFYVNTQTQCWSAPVRRAALSSFGIGGTNAHAIMEQAPETEPSSPGRDRQLLTLSARTETALTRKREDLRTFLETHRDISPADVAFTLNLGRADREFRQAFGFADLADAREKLGTQSGLRAPEDRPQIVFLFPGQGTGYDDFGRELYVKEPVFRERIDACCEILRPKLRLDLAEYLFAPAGDERVQALRRPTLWQPALFVQEYALARQWMAWGIAPQAMMGHSIGEYVAATLAGVFSLETALDLIAERGRGTEALPGGAMLAVVQSEEQIRPLLNDEISLGAVNGPGLCVLSGAAEAIETLACDLKSRRVHTIRLEATHAFHSHMVAPLMDPIRDLLAGEALAEPKIPFISNLTGTWITPAQATDPNYWADHTRQAVRFSDGLAALFQEPGRLYLEVGPGKVLTNLAKRHPGNNGLALPSFADGASGLEAVLETMGRLWCSGAPPDWQAFYRDENRRRIPLPTYPFERQSYWLYRRSEAPPAPSGVDVKRDLADWFYIPGWKQARLPKTKPLEQRVDSNAAWLVFLDAGGFAERLAQRLKTLGQTVIEVWEGETFSREDDIRFTLNPGLEEGYDALFQALQDGGMAPDHIVHAFRIDASQTTAEDTMRQLGRGFDSVAYVARALDRHQIDKPVKLGILTHHMQRVAGERDLCPEKATLLGAAWVLPKEFPNLSCKTIDLNPEPDNGALVDAVLSELLTAGGETVAFRGAMRWMPVHDPLHLPAESGEVPFRQNGVYLITHGLQEIGLALAQHLAAKVGAYLILVDRSFFPPRKEWDAWLRDQGEGDFISQKIRRVQTVEAAGGRVQVHVADPADSERMREIVHAAEQTFGAIHGAFHLQGRQAPAGLIQGKSAGSVSNLLAAKIREALVLRDLAPKWDFLVLFSENPAEGGIGKAEHGAAHRFLNHLAIQLNDGEGLPVVTVDWGTWQWREADDEEKAAPHIEKQLEEKRNLFGMSQAECMTALERILSLAVPQVTVSTRDFDAVMAQQNQFTADYFQQNLPEREGQGGGGHARPDLASEYVAPSSEVEQLLAEIWQSFFDIETVGIHDNFFELGGHSLLAVQLLSKLNNTFSTQLTLQVLFDAPTIAQLAAILTKEEAPVEDAEALDHLLSEIEGLSEEEIQTLLASENT